MPADAETDDSNLLARLNALRPSTVSLTSTYQSQASNTGLALHNDLSARFASLGGKKKQTEDALDDDGIAAVSSRRPADDEIEHNEEDEQSLEDLLKELELSKHDATLSKTEEDDAQRLIREAEEALKASTAADDSSASTDKVGLEGRFASLQSRGQDIVSQSGSPTAAIANSQIGGGNEEEHTPTEDQEAAEYISRVLAEAEIEKKDEEAERHAAATSTGPDREHDHNAEASHGEDSEDDGDDSELITLPSAPSDLPSSPSAQPYLHIKRPPSSSPPFPYSSHRPSRKQQLDASSPRIPRSRPYGLRPSIPDSTDHRHSLDSGL